MPFSTGQAVPVSYPVLMGVSGPVLKAVFLAVMIPESFLDVSIISILINVPRHFNNIS